MSFFLGGLHPCVPATSIQVAAVIVFVAERKMYGTPRQTQQHRYSSRLAFHLTCQNLRPSLVTPHPVICGRKKYTCSENECFVQQVLSLPPAMNMMQSKRANSRALNCQQAHEAGNCVRFVFTVRHHGVWGHFCPRLMIRLYYVQTFGPPFTTQLLDLSKIPTTCPRKDCEEDPITALENKKILSLQNTKRRQITLL